MPSPAARSLDGRHRPFGHGSVSLGLHPDSSKAASLQVHDLLHQVAQAEELGLDGVTISEHHAGFPGYLPQPVLLTALVLAGTNSIWCGPCPTLLNLRDPGQVAEEFSWLEASFPGRFGAAVAPGYAASDFEALGVDLESRTAVFDSKVRRLLHNLSREGPLQRDPAVKAWSEAPAPLLSAGNSRRAIRRAAETGLGVVYPGGESQTRLAELTDLYRECGGTGPVVWIKSIRLGNPSQSIDTSVFRQAAAPEMRLAQGFSDGPIVGDSDEVVDRLLDGLKNVGATALNVRITHPGSGESDALVQLQRFAVEVLPVLKAGWTTERVPSST